MDRVRTVTATFNLRELRLTVTKAGDGRGTVSSDPDGIYCGPSCSQDTHDYLYGTRVTLTATPQEGSTFAVWSGGGFSGREPCTVTMDRARSVTATFNIVNQDEWMAGTWAFQYDWGCDGSSRTMIWDINADHTYTTNENEHGTWVVDGNQFIATYSNGTVYTGTLSGNRNGMEGTMRTTGGSTGCWSANRGDVYVLGSWTFQYDWGCDGGPRAMVWDINSDGTYTTSEGHHGTWRLNGSRFIATYSVGTVYTGTVSGDEMEGTMVRYDGALEGCWTASRGGEILAFEASININGGEPSADGTGNPPSP
jgi:hypothetical protein